MASMIVKNTATLIAFENEFVVYALRSGLFTEDFLRVEFRSFLFTGLVMTQRDYYIYTMRRSGATRSINRYERIVIQDALNQALNAVSFSSGSVIFKE